MFLAVVLITCAILPSCYGQTFQEMIGPSYTSTLNIGDQIWQDPYEMFEPPESSPSRWRDPYAMFEPPDPLPSRLRDHHEMHKISEPAIQNICQDSIWKSHYKRLINMILNRANVKTADGLTYEGKLDIEIHAENYNILTEFASSNEEDINDLPNVDEILSNALSPPPSNPTEETFLNWKDYVYIMFWNTNSLICLSCIFILLLSRQFFITNLSLGSVFKRLIFLGWIVDFCFCWFNLLQEAEMNKMITLKKFSSIPDNCDPKSLSLWSYIGSLLSSSDDCKEYYHALYTNHFFTISPFVVFSQQLGIIIYTPAGRVGEALGSFASGMLGQLPWGLNFVLLPVLLVFSAIIICIGFLFLTEKSLNISVLGIFKFSFGNDNENQRAIQGVVNNLTERSVIEDVRPTASTSKMINSKESNKCKITGVESKPILMELTINIPQTEDQTKTASVMVVEIPNELL